MKPAAAKEKSATAIARARATGPSRSYLQTRVRGQRLYEAAFILAIVKLTRRLHQAYQHAYDKQAADRLLPQNPTLVNQDAWERRHITSDACGHMADVAQQQANRALRQAHGNASRALGAFDLGFSKIYAGKPMDGISNAIDLYQNGPTGRTIGSYYQGETGFKVQYMDTGADMLQGHSDADQTHHFTAMFSAGVNATGINWISATAHNFNDNEGDQRLTNAAYDLGSRLAGDPNSLRRIGALIRSEICDPKTRGRHL